MIVDQQQIVSVLLNQFQRIVAVAGLVKLCLLYTSDAADERSSVDLGGRRIIKKKNSRDKHGSSSHIRSTYTDISRYKNDRKTEY